MRTLPASRIAMRAVAAVVAAGLLVAACSPTTPRARKTTAPPTTPSTTAPSTTGPSPTGSPTDPFLQETPQQMARRLAGEVFQRDTGEAAMRAILTRSGIPIIAADTGRLTNVPTRPTYVDAAVYDFQIPMLAAAERSRQTWFLEDLQDLPDWLMGPVLGKPMFGPGILTEGLPRWVSRSIQAENRPGAFAGLVFRELGLRHAGRPDVFGSIDPNAFPIDPLQFLLAGASMLSRTGTVTAGSCGGLKMTLDDEVEPMSLAAFLPGQTEPYARVLRRTHLRRAQTVLFSDLVLLSTVLLRGSDDADHTVTAPVRGLKRTILLTAVLAFNSPIPRERIRCGPLAGLTMPADGPLPGWAIVWTLLQDTERLRPATDADFGKIGNVEGGATEDAGEFTSAGGRSTLTLQVLPVPPDVHGPTPPAVVTVLGEVDVFRTGGRFDVFDLVPRFNRFEGEVRHLARFWARQAVIEIGLPIVLDRLTITYPTPE